MSRRRIAALCWLAGALNALAWSLITPPFHVPDEISHFAYAQVLAEQHELPRDQPGAELAPDLAESIAALQFFGVIGNPRNKPIRTAAAQEVLRQVEARDLPSTSNGEAVVAASQPPLYYLAEAAAYAASPWDDVLDRLQVMRFLSALLWGTTAAFVALFAAELFPTSRPAWAAGGLAVAFQPLAAFIGGGVNGDVLLYVASAALFYALARLFRRGLALRTGAAVGAVLLVGLFAKLTFQALVPMALVGLLLAAWQGRGGDRRAVLSGLVAALAIGLVPFVVYHFGQDALRVAAAGAPDPAPLGQHDTRELLSYLWQLYLPRMPWQTDLLPEVPPYNLWFVGLVGRFGWLDYSFPGWANQLALGLFVAGTAVVARAAWILRGAVRRHAGEIVVYAVGVAILLGIVGFVGYGALKDKNERFEQARYLLPLLALYGGLVALGVRGLGRRWQPAAAAAVVAVTATHSLLGQLLTLARYYG